MNEANEGLVLVVTELLNTINEDSFKKMDVYEKRFLKSILLASFTFFEKTKHEEGRRMAKDILDRFFKEE